jgi:hypothetical protein
LVFVLGCILILLSVIMLPWIVLNPSSVANLFNAGAITILVSFTVLWGARDFCINRFLYGKRSIYAMGFLATLIICVYFSFLRQSYLMTLISLLGELCFVIYFIASYFPGGIEGVNAMFKAAWTTLTACFRR